MIDLCMKLLDRQTEAQTCVWTTSTCYAGPHRLVFRQIHDLKKSKKTNLHNFHTYTQNTYICTNISSADLPQPHRTSMIDSIKQIKTNCISPLNGPNGLALGWNVFHCPQIFFFMNVKYPVEGEQWKLSSDMRIKKYIFK